MLLSNKENPKFLEILKNNFIFSKNNKKFKILKRKKKWKFFCKKQKIPCFF